MSNKPDFAALGREAGEAFAEFSFAFVKRCSEAIQDNINKLEEEKRENMKDAYARAADKAMLAAFPIAYQAAIDTADEFGCFAPEPEEEPEAEGMYTHDCTACWCDGCGKLEDCPKYEQKGDGVEPSPCVECYERRKSGALTGNLLPITGEKPECYTNGNR